jgi:hypothetical protein
MLFPADLATLDVLPPHCTLEAEAKGHPVGMQIRFRVERPRRWRRRQKSDWSGWFVWSDEPIRLTWEAFWPS